MNQKSQIYLYFETEGVLVNKNL